MVVKANIRLSQALSTTGLTASALVPPYHLKTADMLSRSYSTVTEGIVTYVSQPLRSYPAKVAGIKQRARGPKFAEHFNQAQLFYNSLAPHEKAHLIAAVSFELDHCDDRTVYEGYTRVLNEIDFDLAKQVAIKVGGIVPDKPARANHGKTSKTLTQSYYMPKSPTIVSRRIAILLADGFNFAEVEAVRAALASAKAVNFIIGPRRGKVYPGGQTVGVGEGIEADHHFEGQRSTMFDALFIPGGAEHAQTLANDGRVVHWVREAFGHLKTIGAIGEGLFVRSSISIPALIDIVHLTRRWCLAKGLCASGSPDADVAFFG